MPLISPHSGAMVMKLTVVSGPDTGLAKAFRQDRVTLGRSSSNDFVLTDGFISNRHGELTMENDELVYRDLRSRHGSLVVVDSVSLHLHNKARISQVKVKDGSEMQLGATLVRLNIEQRESSLEADTGEHHPSVDQPANWSARAMRETLITTAHRPVTKLTQTFEAADKRLGILFRLAGQLNGLNGLDEIMELIVEATFEAFPAANFFALTLIEDSEEDASLLEADPYMTRVRGSLASSTVGGSPILSKSILRRVIETRESALFVKDSLGSELTKSIIDAQITACMCAPLVGQRSLLGVMQVDTRGQGSLFSRKDLELFNVLASNVAFALERAWLSENIVQMFESFVHASVNAIEARDPTTAGHSERVASYTLELAKAVDTVHDGPLSAIRFSANELTELHYAALLHDFGKIAVRENVLNKGARVHDATMELIAQRFETIKTSSYQHMLHVRIHEATDAGRAVDPSELVQIRERFEAYARELDEILSWLEEIAHKGFLSDEEIARVRTVGARQYIDVLGQRRPFLLADEIKNLCIQRGTLNAEEWENMRSHAARSQEFLEMIPWSDELSNIPCIAGAHHEKLDGSGYPLGLVEAQLSPQIRMLTIADIFDALTASDRPYRKAAPIERAIYILREEAGEGKLDIQLVDVFAELVVPRIRAFVPSANRDS